MYLLVDFSYLFVVELLLSEGGIRHDSDLLLLIVNAQLLEFGLAGEVCMLCLIRDKVCIQILLSLLLINSIL